MPNEANEIFKQASATEGGNLNVFDYQNFYLGKIWKVISFLTRLLADIAINARYNYF